MTKRISKSAASKTVALETTQVTVEPVNQIVAAIVTGKGGFKNFPASAGQIAKLLELGISHAPDINQSEAGKLIYSASNTPVSGDASVMTANPKLAARLQALGHDIAQMTYSAAAKLEASIKLQSQQPALI